MRQDPPYLHVHIRNREIRNPVSRFILLACVVAMALLAASLLVFMALSSAMVLVASLLLIVAVIMVAVIPVALMGGRSQKGAGKES